MSKIDRQTEDEGSLQIGPTDKGMVRIFVTSERFDLPMDFTPDEALEIAREITEAANTASQPAK